MLCSIVLITGTAPNTAASKPKNKFELSKPSKKDKELLTEKMMASIHSLEVFLNEGLEKASLNLHT